jgi:ABC-type polysaccharide/polyol phosphate export permease
VTGAGVPWTVVLAPVPILAMLALVTGAGMLIASAAVFFYDVLDITRVLVQLLYYLTPVFYTIEFIPDRFTDLVRANPLFSYLEVFRDTMYRGVVSPIWEWAMMLGPAGLALSVGVWVFSKFWRNLVSTL